MTLLEFIKESNHDKHFIAGLLIAVFFTVITSTGCMVTAEWKDKQHVGKFDWIDILFGVIGGLVGQFLQI